MRFAFCLSFSNIFTILCTKFQYVISSTKHIFLVFVPTGKFSVAQIKKTTTKKKTFHYSQSIILILDISLYFLPEKCSH